MKINFHLCFPFFSGCFLLILQIHVVKKSNFMNERNLTEKINFLICFVVSILLLLFFVRVARWWSFEIILWGNEFEAVLENFKIIDQSNEEEEKSLKIGIEKQKFKIRIRVNLKGKKQERSEERKKKRRLLKREERREFRNTRERNKMR